MYPRIYIYIYICYVDSKAIRWLQKKHQNESLKKSIKKWNVKKNQKKSEKKSIKKQKKHKCGNPKIKEIGKCGPWNSQLPYELMRPAGGVSKRQQDHQQLVVKHLAVETAGTNDWEPSTLNTDIYSSEATLNISCPISGSTSGSGAPWAYTRPTCVRSKQIQVRSLPMSRWRGSKNYHACRYLLTLFF